MILKSNEVEEYNILRAIAILLVVLGHSTYFIIITSYGGIDYSNVFFPSGRIYNFLEFIGIMIYNFHMPLFVFISGAVHYLFVKKRECSFKELFKIKFKRLMLPYFIVGIFYMIPLKYISNFYSENTLSEIFINGLLLFQCSGHLWFLFMLFMVFLIFKVFERYMIDNKYSVIIMPILLFLNIFSDKIPIDIFQNIAICKYLIWFYLGFKFEESRVSINKLILNYKHKLFFVFLILFILTSNYSKNFVLDIDIMSKWIFYRVLLLIIAILGIITAYIFALIIRKSSIINFINKYSFHIYLLHDPLNYIILAIINSINAFGYFTHGIGYLVFVIVRFSITLLLSILIKVCIDKIIVR